MTSHITAQPVNLSHALRRLARANIEHAKKKAARSARVSLRAIADLKARGEPLGCVATVANTRTLTELCALAAADVTPHLAGVLRLEGIESLGHAHVGGGVGTYGDCTHYCLDNGVVDIWVSEVMRKLGFVAARSPRVV